MSTTSPLPASLFTSKSSQPWERDKPFPQPLYHFSTDTNGWNPTSSTAEIPSRSETTPPSQIRLLTWNIDALVPYAEQRMATALEYLKKLYHDLREKPASNTTTGANDNTSTSPPLIIFFQEMLKSDLQQIQKTDWIRENFYITDLTDEFWEGVHFGTTTLVEKRLDVHRVFRVHYKDTRMQRDGLFVDVAVRYHDSGNETTSSPLILRLCNTHLESLTQIPPHRPLQMEVASRYMKGSGSSDQESSASSSIPIPHAALLAGDLNAFSPEDLKAVKDCSLEDAFLTLGGKDGTEEGYTWGQQVPEELQKLFGCSRMDKILFYGAIAAEKLERIGEGIKAYVGEVPLPEGHRDRTVEKEVWVTDHLGLLGEFTILKEKKAVS